MLNKKLKFLSIANRLNKQTKHIETTKSRGDNKNDNGLKSLTLIPGKTILRNFDRLRNKKTKHILKVK